jgi:predicted Ser/Thr protein kinase
LKKAAEAEKIETVLKEKGYSEKTVKEILKWYNGSD